MSGLEITNEDCTALMERYPDKYFDLAIVDPPYGIGCERGTNCSRKKINTRKKWDVRPNESYFTELFRVSKNQIVWGGNYFNLPIRRGWICWYKTDQVKNRSFSEIELAWTSFDVSARHFTTSPFICEERFHPTQKPVALYKWLLYRYAEPGWNILDTHLGSGSIAVACFDMGYGLTACEIDKDYYEAAMERIKIHRAQNELFDAAEMLKPPEPKYCG
jgi:site-specific DNA-methyltransferase (adenine-specific)